MKSTLCLLVLSGLLLAQDQGKDLKIGTKVGQKIPAFKVDVLNLSEKKAVKSSWKSHKTANPTVYIFVSQNCPVVTKYRQRLRQVTKDFAKKKVDFVFVYPMRKATLESKTTFHRKEKFNALLCDDNTLALAKKLAISKTPEIIVTAKTGEIIFRGCIDDKPARPKKVKHTYLKTALTEHLAGKPVKVKTSRLYG